MNFHRWVRPTADSSGSRIKLLVPALAVGASLVAAAPASASTLNVDYGQGAIAYQAAAGEANDVTIDSYGLAYRVQDQGVSALSFAQLGGASACTTLEAWKFRCPQTGLTHVSVGLGDGTDKLDTRTVSLPVSVDAGPGAKEIRLGGGADVVSVRNGSVDEVDCGAGDDTVFADVGDQVASDCEHVDLGGIAVTTSGGDSHGGRDDAQGTGDGSLTAPIGVVLPHAPVTMPQPDRAIVHVACAPGEVGGCHGEITLELPSHANGVAGTHKVIAARGHFVSQQRRIGRARYRLAAGQSANVPVRILLRGHYSLFSRHRTRRAVLRVVERDATGKVVGVETRSVLLRPATNKWSRVRRHTS